MEYGLQEIAAKIYEFLFCEEDMEWEAVKDNIQDFINAVDEYIDVSDYDEDELAKTVHDTIELRKNMMDHFYIKPIGSNMGMLQLSDERTLYKVDVKSEEEYLRYWFLMKQIKKECEDEAGITLYLLGRSDRHVCVHNTYSNAIRFNELCELVSQYEQRLVDEFNAGKQST